MRNFFKKAAWQAGAILAASVMSCLAHGAQEGIALDPATGDYTITYRSGDGYSTTTYIPGNKVAPSVQSTFKQTGATVVYRYSVTNGKTAKQAIEIFHFNDIPHLLAGEVAISPIDSSSPDFKKFTAELEAAYEPNQRALNSPSRWDSDIDIPVSPHESHIIKWISNDTKGNPGILPGNKVSGFGFASPDLPGILPAELSGLGSGIVYADEGPADDDPIAKQIEQLQQNDFVYLPAAAPSIAVPNPFDAAVLLGSIQTQMQTWIGMQLLDATFSSQLDRYFQSAISACQLNQPGVCKQQIETMRALIKKEQPDAGNHEGDSGSSNQDGKRQHSGKLVLIGPLAASVLDFDLQYVTKRMDEGDGEHASTGGSDSASNHSEHRRKK